jgi:acetyltransferase
MFSAPRSVAVIGASREPAKLGYGVLKNIIQYGYPGPVYPINPGAQEILGHPCYPSVLDVPGPVDLAVIVIPATHVAKALEECGQKGVRGVIIISAGFREVGGEGARMERELIAIAQRYGMRIIGPNVLGVIDTITPINASFAAGMPDRGTIAFLSQSGALCTAILDWARSQGIGFSRFVSIGNKADVNEIDLLQEWGNDPETNVIIAYLEGITDGARFLEVARRVTKGRPVIALKSGSTGAGAKAVSSHTGTLAGSERAYDAAFSQAGVLRANSVQDLFDYSVAFAYQPLLRDDRIAIVTNAGGPGIMATDACERSGLKLASLTAETQAFLAQHLPAASNVHNPIDVLGDALADRYALAVEAALKDPGVDGVLVILTPQVMTQIEETARAIVDVAKRYADLGKPIFGCFMGDLTTRAGARILNENRIPNYQFPERAMAAFKMMSLYRTWQRKPAGEYPRYTVNAEKVRTIFATARREGRLALGDFEAREVLAAYGLHMPQSALARTPDEAVTIANQMGYPVVLKITSPDILHKSDIGGVKVGLSDPTAVRDAFELITYRAQKYVPGADIWGCTVQEMVGKGREVIIGMSRDPQFGPLLLFGLGGIYVEVLKDVTFRIAPVSRQEAMEMISDIRSFPLLRGVRGEKPADLEAATEAILRVSQLVTDFPEIVEIDINPLVLFEKGAVAVDMRIILQ